MSQFRIKGIDYADEDLQHGLGIGSGRGRPKGSKNGQVMPGAAYMKNYKIVGEKAEGTDNLPGAKNTSRKLVGPVNPNLQRDYQRTTSQRSQTRRQASSNDSRLANGARMVRSNSNRLGTRPTQSVTTEVPTTNATDNRAERTPSENVSAGRDFVQQMMRNVRIVKSNSNQQGKLVPQPEVTTKDDAPGTSKDRREFVDEVLNNAPDNIDTLRQRFLGPVGATDPNQPGNTNPNSGGSGKTNQNGNTPQKDQTPPASNQQGQGQTPPASNQQGQGQTPPAQQRQETPEQKSFWDNVGGWFAQAGKDIGNTVVGALNTAGGAVSDAANWVGNRLKEGGEWALASMGDVGEWVGDRAKDLDAWWNGRDIEVNDNGRERQEHQTGAREAIENWWNGRDTVNIQDGTYRRNHEAGARENIGNALNAVGQWIGNAAGDVGRTVGGAANTAGQWVGNAAGDVGRAVGNAANAAGQWIGNAAGDVGRTVGGAANAAGQWAGDRARDVRNFVYGVQPGSADAAPYWDLRTGEYVVPTITPGLGVRIGNTVNDAWNGVTGAVNDAGQWVNNNVVTPVSNAAKGVGTFVRDTADNVGQAVNNAGQAIGNFASDAADAISATPGAAAGLSRAIASGVPAEDANRLTNNYVNGQITREEYEDAIDRLINESGPWGSSKPKGIGQTVSDAFNDAGRAIGDAATNAWNGAVDAANNAGRAIGNFAGNAGQTVTNAYNQVTGNTMENADNATARALNAGIPADYVGQLRDQLTLGLINPAQYVQQINNLLGNPNMTDPNRR